MSYYMCLLYNCTVFRCLYIYETVSDCCSSNKDLHIQKNIIKSKSSIQILHLSKSTNTNMKHKALLAADGIVLEFMHVV